MKVRKSSPRNKKYVLCGQTNDLIKRGDWKQHFSEEIKMTIGELLSIIHSFYEIEDDCRLYLSYKSMKRTKMSETILMIDDNKDDLIARQIKDEIGMMRALTIDDSRTFCLYQERRRS